MKSRYGLLILTLSISLYSQGQTNLSAGDLAIVYMNLDGNDHFGFVAFVEVSAGTVIHFTERGYGTGTGTLVGTEATISWTASSTIAAGTLVSVSTPKSNPPGVSSGSATRTGSWSLSGGGDQILVYQGSVNSPTQYIYVLNLTGDITSGGVTTKSFDRSVVTGGGPGASPTQNTNVPAGLTEGVNALAFSDHKDNVQFKFALAGATLSDFMNPDNYNRSNSDTYSGAGTELLAASAPEINVKQLATDIASRGDQTFGTVQIGTSKDIEFTVENTGDGDLNITSITPSGSGFSVQAGISANPVSASGSATFTIRFQPTATSQTTGSVTIANDDDDEGSYVINFTAGVTDATFSIKVYLEGPLSGTAMSTSISGSIPKDPNDAYAGVLEETAVASLPTGAADWVEVEIRTGTAASTKAGTNRAGILKDDGIIVDKDGNDFTMSQADGSDFYIVIHHRNHLSVMSSAVVVNNSGTYQYDFTTAQTQSYSNTADGAIKVGTVYAMISGDADHDGDVDVTDLTTWRMHNGNAFNYGSNGNSDLNLDGVINAVDRNDFHGKNSPKTSQVPTG